MTTDGQPERPEFESQQVERILRRLSEAILVSADTTRKVEEGAAFAARQDFIDTQVAVPDVLDPNDPFAGPSSLPGDHPFDPGMPADKPDDGPARSQEAIPDAPVDPFADPGEIGKPRHDPFGGVPALPDDHPFDDGQDDGKPDFAMLAQAPPLPESLDPMVADALQFQDLEFAGNEQDGVEDDEQQQPEQPPPDFPKQPENVQGWNEGEFAQFTFDGVESSVGGRRAPAMQQFAPPADMPEHPMQVGEQTALFHEDDSTILQMVQQYREADQQFRKGIMDVFERIIMDMHADNARLMNIARHFQQSRRSTR